MIVPMRRIDLLCVERERDAVLRDLRELGAVHVRGGGHVGGDSVEGAMARLNRLERLLGAIPADRNARPSGRRPEEILAQASELLAERQRIEEERSRLKGREAEVAPYGEFSPGAVRELEAHGINVGLYRCGRDVSPAAPANAVLCELGESRGTRFFAILGAHQRDSGWVAVPLPERSLAEIRAALGALEGRLREVEAQLVASAGDRVLVEGEVILAREEVEFQRVRAGMGLAGPVVHLSGYCPATETPALVAAAHKKGWGLAIREPGPDEIVPTLIRNPAWIRPFETVMDAIGLVPGYRESDMSPAMMVFFSIFFAMIVGDAGYGLVCLGLAWGLRRKFPKAPAAPFQLMTILGACTVAWGIVVGDYFGLRAPWHLRWVDAEDHLVSLCFLIGAIHLTLAHLWSAVRLYPSAQMLAQVGWILSTWTMYFAALSFILGNPFPHWMLYLFVTGLVLILLFMTPLRQLRAEWHNHLVLPLSVVSNFGDVVSYVRLFAVGLAGYEVASNFNATAWGMGHGGIIGWVAAVVLLFVAHGMNIALSALGVVVHGVRLNALEFSSHLGVQWAGIRYAPFARRSRAGEANFDVAAAGLG